MQPITVYVASKSVHGKKWITLFESFKATGVELLSTWVYESGPDETMDFVDLWQRCLNEASSANVCIVYRETGEQLKGALVEVGAALAAGRCIILVGDFEGAGSWPNLPQIMRAKDMDAAVMMAAHMPINVDRDQLVFLRGNERKTVLNALEIAYGDDEEGDLSDEDYGALVAKFD